MGKRKGSPDRRSGKKRRTAARGSRRAPSSAGVASARRRQESSPPQDAALPVDAEEEGEVLVAQWRATRAGPRAGRGFHFQDAVGAWLAVQVAVAAIDARALVPEGLEDMSLEGGKPLHIQVKSRVERLGPFPPRLAARHILDAWSRHQVRLEKDARLAVVLERGVGGEPDLNRLDRVLADSLSTGSPLQAGIERLAAERGIGSDELDSLLATTAVLGTTWEVITAETTGHLGNIVSVPPSALILLARELRIVVAEVSDANEAAQYDERRSLDRTGLIAGITRSAEHIDLDSLESAIRKGICEPLELDQPTDADDRFYEGTSTQPSHVAAGLVVPRPDVVAEVLAGLQDQSAAVLTGPSGVGKSAVLWTVPLALPGVLWFRVRRLSAEDAPVLIRLARAYGATREAPVGFLVDSAGTSDFRGWARLRAEAAAVPGVLLVGTARREDLMTLGDLSGCATVTVSLNEASAEAIFAGLVRRGATAAPHWAEAFERSSGLTLEFTHILTSGRRLDDVVGEQVRRRIDEGRHRELEVLSLVSVADRWAATVSTADVAAACGGSDFELRQTVSRLAEEHLLVERDGIMSGLHRLRSATRSTRNHRRMLRPR
jgi:hypothetical protein